MSGVLIVDDSALVRQAWTQVIEKARGLEVLGAVADPYFALEFLRKKKPDIILLDIEMPRMDGLSFLRKLMKFHPLPVVMCSTLTQRGSVKAMEAYTLGAVQVVGKPTGGDLKTVAAELVLALHTAARVDVTKLKAQISAGKTGQPAPLGQTSSTAKSEGSSGQLIIIGSSTGGTVAVEQMLLGLPASVPGIVVVQHMPEHFTAAFADRLDGIVTHQVREAQDSDVVRPGCVLIAPGGKQLIFKRRGAQTSVCIEEAASDQLHKPSVDVAMKSAAALNLGAAATGVILTGMGSDGAQGMRALRDNGALTLGQDEETSVVYGMPNAARVAGGVAEELPLQEIPGRLLRRINRAAA